MAVTARRFVGPRACLEAEPRMDSVKFGGRFINIRLICEKMGGADHGYISRILAGKADNPSLQYTKRVADALAMTLDDLLTAIEDRKQALDDDYHDRLSEGDAYEVDDEATTA